MIEQIPAEVLRAAGLSAAAVSPVSWEDPMWLCEWAGGRAVVSRKKGRTSASLAWERRLLDHLASVGFPSQRAAPMFGGSDFLEYGGAHYVARSWLEGATLTELGWADLFALGRFMAEYHFAVESFAGGQRPGFGGFLEFLAQPSAGALECVLGEASLVGRYRSIVDELAGVKWDAGEAVLAIHADFTTRNVVGGGSPPSIVGLIDFGMAQLGPPEGELAFGLGSARPALASVEVDVERAADLVRGYLSVRPLGAGWSERIVDLARARSLFKVAWWALSGGGSGGFGVETFERVDWLSAHRTEMIMALAGRSA